MKNIIPRVSTTLFKMWNKIINLETSLLPVLKEELRLEKLSSKESKVDILPQHLTIKQI